MWMCLICGWIYDEERGAPDDGIASGTKWEDVPINWTRPEYGVRKENFEVVQVWSGSDLSPANKWVFALLLIAKHQEVTVWWVGSSSPCHKRPVDGRRHWQRIGDLSHFVKF